MTSYISINHVCFTFIYSPTNTGDLSCTFWCEKRVNMNSFLKRFLRSPLLKLYVIFYSIVEAEYLITTPYEYRPGQDETVSVLLFGSKSCEVEVRLKQRNDDKIILARASGNFTAGERGNLILRVMHRAQYSK